MFADILFINPEGDIFPALHRDFSRMRCIATSFVPTMFAQFAGSNRARPPHYEGRICAFISAMLASEERDRGGRGPSPERGWPVSPREGCRTHRCTTLDRLSLAELPLTRDAQELRSRRRWQRQAAKSREFLDRNGFFDRS